MNTFGRIFRLTTWGESHGTAIGGVVDGMPAGVRIDHSLLERQMALRSGGRSPAATPRREADRVSLMSGILDDVTTGAPIAFLIANGNIRPADYDALADVYRPGHGDYSWEARYGLRDHRGGGRLSARETATRVAAGALAQMALDTAGIRIEAYVKSIGSATYDGPFPPYDVTLASALRCPPQLEEQAMALLADALAEGDTLGGIVECRIVGAPAGLGSPVFDKLQATLAHAMMSLPAAKGFEYGDGFDMARRRGTDVVDTFVSHSDGSVGTLTNHSGGIQGGISNGMDITLRVAFKPVASLRQPLQSIDRRGHTVTIPPRGRHDVCVAPRAVVAVEAMAAIATLDALLQLRTARM